MRREVASRENSRVDGELDRAVVPRPAHVHEPQSTYLPVGGQGCSTTVVTIEYVRYRVPAERSAEFVDAYRRAAVHLAAAPECRDVELARCEEDAESYVLRVTGSSTRDHLEGSPVRTIDLHTRTRPCSPRATRSSHNGQ